MHFYSNWVNKNITTILAKTILPKTVIIIMSCWFSTKGVATQCNNQYVEHLLIAYELCTLTILVWKRNNLNE